MGVVVISSRASWDSVSVVSSAFAFFRVVECCAHAVHVPVGVLVVPLGRSSECARLHLGCEHGNLFGMSGLSPRRVLVLVGWGSGAFGRSRWRLFGCVWWSGGCLLGVSMARLWAAMRLDMILWVASGLIVIAFVTVVQMFLSTVVIGMRLAFSSSAFSVLYGNSLFKAGFRSHSLW